MVITYQIVLNKTGFFCILILESGNTNTSVIILGECFLATIFIKKLEKTVINMAHKLIFSRKGEGLQMGKSIFA